MNDLFFLPRREAGNALAIEPEFKRQRRNVSGEDELKTYLGTLKGRRAPSNEVERKLLIRSVEFNSEDAVRCLLERGWCNTKEQLEELKEISIKKHQMWGLGTKMMNLLFEYRWTDVLGVVHRFDASDENGKIPRALEAAKSSSSVIGEGAVSPRHFLRLCLISVPKVVPPGS